MSTKRERERETAMLRHRRSFQFSVELALSQFSEDLTFQFSVELALSQFEIPTGVVAGGGGSGKLAADGEQAARQGRRRAPASA